MERCRDGLVGRASSHVDTPKKAQLRRESTFMLLGTEILYLARIAEWVDTSQ
jgi:hypothetical protein